VKKERILNGAGRAEKTSSKERKQWTGAVTKNELGWGYRNPEIAKGT